MRIAVNGEPTDVADDATVADVVTTVTTVPSGVAVARNGELVARGQWTTVLLAEADQLEVLSATAGG